MAKRKAKKAEQAPKAGTQEPPKPIEKAVLGLKLEVLRSIIGDLNGSAKLQKLLGNPPCEKIGIVAMNNDLKFMELPTVKLSGEDKLIFLTEMDALLRSRFVKK
jgi:hypothetical protein